MTDEQIAAIARKHGCSTWTGEIYAKEKLFAFARAVAEAAVEAERERCLALVRGEKSDWRGSVGAIERIETAIRNRP